MLHFQVDFRAHVIDRPDECFAVFLQRRSENEVRNFYRVVVVRINQQILRLKIPVRKASVVDLAKPVNDLLEIVPRDLFLQSPGLAQDDKQVCLIRWKHKVGVDEVFEDDFVGVEAFDYVGVFYSCKNLFLVFGFVNLAVELLVELYNYLCLCRCMLRQADFFISGLC